ncbi:MAG: hypothetical protein KAH33_01545, partial [Candidatus Delongbacteria bacterium]|nr:hypothetical protein [Candidatus Delongbacteria bacterium]
MTHELIHSLTLLHCQNSNIMIYGNATTTSIVPIGADEKSGYVAIYNSPEILKPDTLASSRDSILVITGQKVDFKILPKVDETPSYIYETSLYEVKTNLSSTLLANKTLPANDTIRYTWDTSAFNLDTINVECYIKDAEEVGKTSYTDDGGYTKSCNQRSAKRRFSICDFMVYNPTAGTSIVVEEGNHIPIRLKTKDYAEVLNLFDNVYNVDNMKVKYKLWYNGWFVNDTISTSATLDPRVEFEWSFTPDGANNTINMNHEKFIGKNDYKITAMLYVEENSVLNY